MRQSLDNDRRVIKQYLDVLPQKPQSITISEQAYERFEKQWRKDNAILKGTKEWKNPKLYYMGIPLIKGAYI